MGKRKSSLGNSPIAGHFGDLNRHSLKATTWPTCILDFGQASSESAEERRVNGNPVRADEVRHRRIHLTAALAPKQEVRNRSYEVDERGQRPEPPVAVNLIRRAMPHIPKRRGQQRDLQNGPEHAGDPLSGRQLAPLFRLCHGLASWLFSPVEPG
jgi:hypothetical protein